MHCPIHSGAEAPETRFARIASVAASLISMPADTRKGRPPTPALHRALRGARPLVGARVTSTLSRRLRSGGSILGLGVLRVGRRIGAPAAVEERVKG